MLVLVVDGISAFFGTLSAPTHGSDGCGWALEEAPPALRNEEIAIATALLWLLQSTRFCRFQDIVLYYDCMSAGRAVEGIWHPSSAFAGKARDLQRWIESAVGPTFQFEHVKAHTGHPLNDYVDWAAKKAATGNAIGGRPPASTVTAFQELDCRGLQPFCDQFLASTVWLCFGVDVGQCCRAI